MSKYTHRDSLQNEILICNEDKIKKKKAIPEKTEIYIQSTYRDS